MVTMKAYTSSLTPILLLVFVSGVCAGEPEPVDYMPVKAHKLYLPTTIGAPPNLNVDQIGAFSMKYMQCGKMTVHSKDDLELHKDTNFEVFLDCTPNPMRVVYSKQHQIQVVGALVDLNKCQGLQTCQTVADLKETNLGDKKVAAEAEFLGGPEEDNICTPSMDKVLFSNEMGCNNPTDVPNYNEDHKKVMFIAPRFKTNDMNLFEVLRPFTFSGIGRKDEPSVIPRTNPFLKFKQADILRQENVWKSCIATCDMGNIIKFNMKKGSWKTVIYLKGKTQGFKVCIGSHDHESDTTTPKCPSRFELFILPRNGLVVWPKNGRSSLIELKSKELGEDNAYAIEFGYGLTGKDGALKGEFYVANMYGEMVISDSDGWNQEDAARISFFFQNSDDLVKDGGIVSKQIETGKTFVPKDKADLVEEHPVTNPLQGKTVDSGGEALVNTPEEPPIPLVATTTASPKRLSSNVHPGILLHSTDNSNDAIYMPGKWWAWGLYIGFIIGSIVGVGIIGGIFYVLRRTVYGFWYRGMYKRYGCDASGTTGGITGVGFGNTTTGAITVGGTTGGGGTTMGKTGGTTTGSMTKTGGGTTGSMTSTGGASTIAM